MNRINTKLFGEAEYTKDAGVDFDTKTIVLNNISSTCSVMIFEGLSEADLDKAIKLLDNLEKLDALAKIEILSSNKNSNSITSEFANDHFSDYDEDIKNEIFKKLDINKQDNKIFLENMEVGGVVVYEDVTKGICITLDYNLIWEDEVPFTGQILAIRFNADSKFLSIAYES